MMEHSTDLIATGFSMMPSTQAPSHGAGQTRPVNSTAHRQSVSHFHHAHQMKMEQRKNYAVG
eukprot:COSAG05_NODE_886_length_6751_cov_151.638906_17_plen_62_part_00